MASRGPTASVLLANPFDNLSATAKDVAVKGPGMFDMNQVVPAASVPLPAANPLPGQSSSSSSGKRTHFEIQGKASLSITPGAP